LRKDKLLQLVNPMTVEVALTTASTTITTTTEKYATSGKLFVGGDIMAYTGKTSTQFTGVTNIDIYHNS
jgi:hypothetical protein